MNEGIESRVYSLEHKGRWVEADLIEGIPLVRVEVYQKKGDCPMGFLAEQKKACPGDCHNVFFSILYSLPDYSIAFVGALLKEGIAIDRTSMEKAGLTEERLTEMIKSGSDELDIVKEDNGKTIYYKGIPILYDHRCHLRYSESMEIRDPELRQYMDFVQGNREMILERSGIKIQGAIIFSRKKSVNLIEEVSLKGIKEEQ